MIVVRDANAKLRDKTILRLSPNNPDSAVTYVCCF